MIGVLTNKLINAFCPDENKQEILRLLDEGFSEDFFGFKPSNDLVDRVQLGLIKISGWNVDDIKENINHAKTDWRDFLVCAGFADSLIEHIEWYKKTIESGYFKV